MDKETSRLLEKVLLFIALGFAIVYGSESATVGVLVMLFFFW